MAVKKKLLKYGPILYAVWSNPEARSKIISALETVNRAMQRLGEKRSNPSTATLVQGKGATSPQEGKVESLVQRIPAPLFTTATKGMNSLTEFLVKQDAKDRTSVK